MWSNVRAMQFRNCIAHTLDYIEMQMSKTNREKGYCGVPVLLLSNEWRICMLILAVGNLVKPFVHFLRGDQLMSIFIFHPVATIFILLS